MNREKVLELAQQADVWTAGQAPYQEQLERFASLVEKEIQTNYFNPDWDVVAPMIEEQKRMALRIQKLENALRNVLPYVVAQEINCQGFNCSQSVCMDCFSSSEEHAEQARQAFRNADEVLEGGRHD